MAQRPLADNAANQALRVPIPSAARHAIEIAASATG